MIFSPSNSGVLDSFASSCSLVNFIFAIFFLNTVIGAPVSIASLFNYFSLKTLMYQHLYSEINDSIHILNFKIKHSIYKTIMISHQMYMANFIAIQLHLSIPFVTTISPCNHFVESNYH